MNPHYLPTVSRYVRRWSAHRTLCIEFSSIRMHLDIISNILNMFIVNSSGITRTVQLIQYERYICVVVVVIIIILVGNVIVSHIERR